MLTTPLAEQKKIVLAGLRNSGKSSLMNNLFAKSVAIVSAEPGTTTDPVTRSIELAELGPVSLTDTAGFDDDGTLGNLRISKTQTQLSLADIIIFITPGHQPPLDEEMTMYQQLITAGKKTIFALTYGDHPPHPVKLEWVKNSENVIIDNLTQKGIPELKKILIRLKTELLPELTPVEGLVQENELVLLVTPIDLAAPQGRLILPQVETIRDLLDKDCACLIVKERELKHFYDRIGIRPKLVITDSQAFHKVAADIPSDQPMTSFSILFARKKGDLAFFIEGIKQLKNIRPNAKVLILESCSHHRQADDIGTVKIPRLFKQLVQPQSEFIFAKSLPPESELDQYDLVITCAGCMVNRNLMMNRINTLKDHGIYGINYGLFLAWVNGLLPRAIELFPHEFALWKKGE